MRDGGVARSQEGANCHEAVFEGESKIGGMNMCREKCGSIIERERGRARVFICRLQSIKSSEAQDSMMSEMVFAKVYTSSTLNTVSIAAAASFMIC